VRAKIIEMDPERRRLSLSLKRVEEGEGPSGEAAPDLGLSEEVFADGSEGAPEAPEVEALDESMDADAVAPEEQGPGDSEGETPAPPEEENE
jgi:small subunit ribosomal protein S1